ncbi:MAG: carboxypeptidase regulatory-like domain-containing protein [SAR324 cluster bacterium]|nr:carboxypeptidase regulatory-like domain-containing protein [SAR324 cluster bacterium]
MCKRLLLVAALTVLCFVPYSVNWAVDITGSVKGPDGRGIYGVQIKALNDARKMAKTVFSDKNGNYRIPDLFPESHKIRTRLFGYRDEIREEVQLDERGATIDFTLQSTSDIAEQLSSADYMTMFPRDTMGRAFYQGCTVCHQIGTHGTRNFREEPNMFGDPIGKGPIDTKEEWLKVIEKMRVFDIYAVIPKFGNEELAEWIVKHGYGDPAKAPSKSFLPPLDEAASKVIVTEYWMGGGFTWLHDITTDPNGNVWGGDYTLDVMYKLDPITGAVKNYKYPLARTGAHTLNPDRDGNIWTTLQLADMIASFDPESEQWTVYSGLSKGSLVHTIAVDDFNYVRFDQSGSLWVTEFGANKLASLNPKTKEVKEYDLPMVDIPGYEYEQGPYGIAYDTQDEVVWYTKIGANTLGRIDTRTGQIKQYVMEEEWSGPRRLRIAPDGRVWIPFYSTSNLGVFDPKTEQLKTYKLPHPGDAVYALTVDGATGVVWACGTLSNTIYRFDPKTEKFIVIPMPSSAAYTRMVIKDYTTGDLWTSYSNFPNAHGEFPVGAIVRIELPDELK